VSKSILRNFFAFLDPKSFSLNVFLIFFIFFIVARYYSAEEQYDSEHSHKTAECHLKLVTANLCTIFQVLFCVIMRPS